MKADYFQTIAAKTP